MGKIVMDMSMSLDGFIAAKKDTPDQPLQRSSQKLDQHIGYSNLLTLFAQIGGWA